VIGLAFIFFGLYYAASTYVWIRWVDRLEKKIQMLDESTLKIRRR